MTADERVTWSSDVGAADWMAPRLHPFIQDIGSVVPQGFEAYVRIFHPVDDWRHNGTGNTWSEGGSRQCRAGHPEMQLQMVNRPRGSPPDPRDPCRTGKALCHSRSVRPS